MPPDPCGGTGAASRRAGERVSGTSAGPMIGPAQAEALTNFSLQIVARVSA